LQLAGRPVRGARNSQDCTWPDAPAVGKVAGTGRALRGGGEIPMLDLVFIAATVAFFALAIAYVRACDRL
jgi:hypothetical protein